MERKLIAVAVSSALALPLAAQAVEFSVSGQINRAMTTVDGGGPKNMKDKNDGDLQHVDANASQTRFRFTGSEELENGMTAGVQLEYGLTGNLRHANVSLNTGGGKITLGHGSVATDGVTEANLGGPSWLGGVTHWCSYHSPSDASDADYVSPVCASNDGGRVPSLRYDTPALGPATVSVSIADDDYWDVRLQIAGSFGDAGYDVRIGHTAEYETDVAAVDPTSTLHSGAELIAAHDDLDGLLDDLPDDATVRQVGQEQALVAGGSLNPTQAYVKDLPGSPASKKKNGDITAASAAVAFGQGTSVRTAWTENDTADSETTFLSIDHSYGDGSIGVYTADGEIGSVDGSMWGIGIGHSLGAGATAYAGFRQLSEDGMNDIDLMVVGMRVTFN